MKGIEQPNMDKYKEIMTDWQIMIPTVHLLLVEFGAQKSSNAWFLLQTVNAISLYKI
jgi:hypothetical protein